MRERRSGSNVDYDAYLIEGNDVGGIDVGFLVRSSTIRVDAVAQLAANEILTFDGSLLHDRPPLLLEGAFIGAGADQPIRVLNVHQRSLSGIESSSTGPRVRQKRLEQAESVASIVQQLQEAIPGVALAVVGDFNAFELSDGYVDVVGRISGDFVEADDLLIGPDLVDPDLFNAVLSLSPTERYSFIFQGTAQTLDHALLTEGLLERATGFQYGRGNADAPLYLLGVSTTPLRSSDHDGFALFVTADPDGDGVPTGVDRCEGTQVPEAVPTLELRPNHYALVDGDLVFDTVVRGRGGSSPVYTVADTGGCSCEQIVEALELGEGLRKFGCTRDVMESWIAAGD